MMSHRRIQCSLQSEKSWDPRSDLIPSLYVFECVELELALKLATGDEEDPLESDFSCPIKLHRGRVVVHLVALYSMHLRSSYLHVLIHIRQMRIRVRICLMPSKLWKEQAWEGLQFWLKGRLHMISTKSCHLRVIK